MNDNRKSFVSVIDDTFEKINRFEGGNTLFYKRFHKSRAVVSTWKSGKVQPHHSDILKFIKVANEVIKELRVETDKRNQEQAELLTEHAYLISA